MAAKQGSETLTSAQQRAGRLSDRLGEGDCAFGPSTQIGSRRALGHGLSDAMSAFAARVFPRLNQGMW